MRSKARQRGASAVFVAISMVASIAALGMALDLGRLYFVHRDLQVLADMAALDAARIAGGCFGKVEDPQGAAAGEAAASIQRNGGSLTYLTAGSVEVGRQVQSGGVRMFTPDNSERFDSVRVTLKRPLPSKLVPIFSAGPTGMMSVSAAANMRPIVSLDVGSGLAGINSPVANDLLANLVGGPGVDIRVLGTGGLASASVTLGDLTAAANLGSVEDFLDTTTTTPALLSAIAGALSNTTDAAVQTTLQALATGGDASRTLLPRDILGVPAGATADSALVNVGALISSLADSTNGSNLLNLKLPINVPLLGQGQLGVQLIELARPAIGPPLLDAAGNPQTIANTAQGLITAAVGLRPILGNQVSIKVYAQVAAASGAVSDLQCSQRGRPHSVVNVDAQTTAGRFGIGDLVDLRAPKPDFVTVARLTPDLEIQARTSFDLGADGQETLTFEGPFPAAAQTIGADASNLLPGAVENVQIEFRVKGPGNVGITSDLSQQIASLEDMLRPQLVRAMRDLSDQVIAPAAAILGANLGTAQVTVRSVTVDQPEIYAR